MGNRLSKIVTRTGDQGTTGLATGDRVAKTHERVRAMGDIDELNSHLGVLLAHELPEGLRQSLTRIQHRLFDLGGELSMPGAAMLGETQLGQIESDVEQFNADLPPLKDFVLPGGNAAAARNDRSGRSTRKSRSIRSPCATRTGCRTSCS
jgi:cob(I)alamin adenosyltransferase